MKARFVFEAINFERTGDPLDSMNIGNKKIRDIKSAFRYVEKYVDTMDADELDFRKFRNEIDRVKDTIDVIVVNYLNKTYNINIRLIPSDEIFNPSQSVREIAEYNKDNYYIKFYKNGPGNAFWFEFQNGQIVHRVTQSNKLSTLDQKLGEVLKKYKVL